MLSLDDALPFGLGTGGGGGRGADAGAEPRDERGRLLVRRGAARAGDRAGAAVGRPDAGGLKGARETSHAKAQRGHFPFPFVLSLSKHSSSLFHAERTKGPSTSPGRTDEFPLCIFACNFSGPAERSEGKERV